MTRFALDSMPPTTVAEDYMLHYEGYHGIPSHCRVRVYRPSGAPPVIVATEAYDFEDSGTSITNRAELVHRLAWSRVGEPWPMSFVEHYAEERDTERPNSKGPEEHWDLVSFPLSNDGTPRLCEDLTAGTITTIIGPPDNSTNNSNTRLTQDVAFGQPSWKPLDRCDVEALIGLSLPQEPVRTAIAPATMENSPTMRLRARLFPEPDAQ